MYVYKYIHRYICVYVEEEVVVVVAAVVMVMVVVVVVVVGGITPTRCHGLCVVRGWGGVGGRIIPPLPAPHMSVAWEVSLHVHACLRGSPLV